MGFQGRAYGPPLKPHPFPRVLVTLKSNAAIIADRRIRGVPDIIVEVQSPSTSTYDERVELVAYAMAGVPQKE